MTPKELKLLQDYVKKRYDEVDMDYQTFSCDIDTEISYAENKTIVDNYLETAIPKVVKKKDIDEMKAKNDLLIQDEIRKAEEQVKLEFEKELERIVNTKTSETLERLYFIPNQYIQMVLSKKSKGLLLYGQAGLGKTFHIKRALAESSLEEGKDYVFICGHITPLQFYMKLYHARDKIVIFDDVNILESKINLNMLKACLSENGQGRVEYHTSRALDIPNSFVFGGQVIILLNEKPKNSEHLKAVESRILHHHLEFDYRQKIGVIFDIAKNKDDCGLNTEERLMIAKWIKANTNEATKNLNIRLLMMMFEFYKFNSGRWIDLANAYVQNDEYTMMLIQGLEKNWCESTGKSRETYFRERRKVCSLNAVSKVSSFYKSNFEGM